MWLGGGGDERLRCRFGGRGFEQRGAGPLRLPIAVTSFRHRQLDTLKTGREYLSTVSRPENCLDRGVASLHTSSSSNNNSRSEVEGSMEGGCDPVAAAAAAGKKAKTFIVDLLNRATHDNAAYRTGYELLPADKRAAEWRTNEFARAGFAEMLRARLDKLRAEVELDWTLYEEACSSDDADAAASEGHVQVIRVLRDYDICCWSPQSADLAARNGHLEVVRELRAAGTRCTVLGANLTAASGHLDVVRELRAEGIHCTPMGANLAASHGHLDVVRDLRAHGIHCTSEGADDAAANGHLEVVRDLRAHGIHCTSRGADRALENGFGAVVNDLRAHGIWPHRDLFEAFT